MWRLVFLVGLAAARPQVSYNYNETYQNDGAYGDAQSETFEPSIQEKVNAYLYGSQAAPKSGSESSPTVVDPLTGEVLSENDSGMQDNTYPYRQAISTHSEEDKYANSQISNLGVAQSQDDDLTQSDILSLSELLQGESTGVTEVPQDEELLDLPVPQVDELPDPLTIQIKEHPESLSTHQSEEFARSPFSQSEEHPLYPIGINQAPYNTGIRAPQIDELPEISKVEDDFGSSTESAYLDEEVQLSSQDTGEHSLSEPIRPVFPSIPSLTSANTRDNDEAEVNQGDDISESSQQETMAEDTY